MTRFCVFPEKNLSLKEKLEILLDLPTAKVVRLAGGESNKNKSEGGGWWRSVTAEDTFVINDQWRKSVRIFRCKLRQLGQGGEFAMIRQSCETQKTRTFKI